MSKLIILTALIIVLFSCSERKAEEVSSQTEVTEKCPCDSIGRFFEKGKNLIQFYLGKSQIEFKFIPGSDTVDVTRYYTEDSIWHVQEYLVVKKDSLIFPFLAIYIDIKDTLNFYKLSFVRNEEVSRNPDLIVNKSLGINAHFAGETLKSNNLSILIPKNQVKGIISIDKNMEVTFRGKIRPFKTTIQVEAENLIKYGNLLEQYKLINRLCNKNTDAKNN